MFKVEELALDKDDSDSLAKATANLLAEFDITPDPKIQATIGLIMACGMVYGPKFVMYNNRIKAEKKKPATLHILTPGGAPVSMPEDANK